MFSFRLLLLRHGYAFLLLYVCAVQLGLPIPADPLLLIMGALVGDGTYSFWLSFVAATGAALAGDWFWYELGRRRGRSVLKLLCRLSIEPDTCVRNTEAQFNKRGAWTLLFAKFIPGASLLSTPLAGVTGMKRTRFLLADFAGCAIWTSAYLIVGKLLHTQVTQVIAALGLFGRQATLMFAILITLYVGWKYLQRWRFKRELRINRVTPDAAFEMLQKGGAVTLVDLRNLAEIRGDGYKISGALIVTPEELRSRSHEIPKDHQVIVYCSCPSETTSARVALQLKRAGVRKVRPLAGGFEAWRERGLPVEPFVEDARTPIDLSQTSLVASK